jgi:anti-sigma factor RsiW
MSKLPPLNEQEKADLVAYLDGELTGEAARAMERKLSLNPAVRAEADALKRTWDLLDYLPTPEPSVSFTEQTLSKLMPVHKGDILRPVRQFSWRWAWIGAGWAAALLISSVIGYQISRRSPPVGPGEKDLVRDLRVIENKRYYDLVDDVEFLRQLDEPDLFGEDSTGQ